MEPGRKAARRVSAGNGQFQNPVTPNMRMILQHMDVVGGNPLTYRAPDITISTGLNRNSVKSALDALYVKDLVERIDTGAEILWRKKVGADA